MVDKERPLQGRRIAIPESRQLDLFADMLETRGADVLRCPLVSIHDAPDQAPIIEWLDQFNRGSCDDLILLTGEGLRRLGASAERAGGQLHEAFVARLDQVRKITRGPKPARELRQLGLRSDLAADSPTTEGIITTLERETLEGRNVGVQLYGSDPNTRLMDYLAGRGAAALPVSPYIYADETEDDQVSELIREIIAGRLDAIAFTSSPQVRRLFSVARSAGQETKLTEAMRETVVAAVGPLVAEALNKRALEIDLMPEDSYFMKPLVRKLVERFGTG